MELLWDSSHIGDQHAADTHMANLRRKIGPERIVTVRALGYKLAEV